MKLSRMRVTGLHLHLALLRLGWPGIVVALGAAIAISGWLWGVTYLSAQLEVQQKALASARQSLQSMEGVAPVPERSTAEARLAEFHSVLGEKHFAEQQIKTLFAAAGQSGLALNQAEYRFTLNKDGDYYTYQITLPVKGSYPAIRQFCERVLLTIPFASLDEISFKREAIGNSMTEARLRFTLYLAPPAGSVEGRQSVERDL